MARYAAIDVGSNSVLLLVAEREQGRFVTVHEECEATRLGQGLDRTGALSPEGRQRTLEVLSRMVQRARGELQVSAIAAAGTMALRLAVDAAQFVEQVREACNLTVQIISGDEEARLSFIAARPLMPTSGEVAVLDLGGASTEVILGQGQTMRSRCSLPIGGLSLAQRFFPSDPSSPEEIADLQRHLQQLSFPELQGRALFVMGGGVTTLAAVELGLEPYDGARVDGHLLRLEELQRQIALYLRHTIEERKAIIGLAPSRADTILAAAAALEQIMQWAEAESLTVCDRGLRHGLLEDRFG